MPEQQPPAETIADTKLELLPILRYLTLPLSKMVLPLVVMQGESVKLVDEAMGQ